VIPTLTPVSAPPFSRPRGQHAEDNIERAIKKGTGELGAATYES
jgi:hypothetical protein